MVNSIEAGKLKHFVRISESNYYISFSIRLSVIRLSGLKTVISSYIGENYRHWDKNLGYVANTINTALHEVTGYSTHFILFGEEWYNHGSFKKVEFDKGQIPDIDRSKVAAVHKNLFEVRESVIQKLRRAYQTNSRYYNLRKRNVDYRVGQLVYGKNFEQSSAVD